MKSSAFEEYKKSLTEPMSDEVRETVLFQALNDPNISFSEFCVCGPWAARSWYSQ